VAGSAATTAAVATTAAAVGATEPTGKGAAGEKRRVGAGVTGVTTG
jgi:hypothetical protein